MTVLTPDAQPHDDRDSRPSSEAAPRIARRRMLGASVGAGLALGAATSLGSLRNADVAHAEGTAERSSAAVPGVSAVSTALLQQEAQPEPPPAPSGPARPSGPVQQRIAPGLADFTDEVLFGDVWVRPELSPRDRALVTVSVLVATGKPSVLAGHLGRALNNGVLPSELSGVLTHLALYCSWPSAVAALEVYDQVYTQRQVDTVALRPVAAPLAPIDSDAARARMVSDQFGVIAPKFAQLTNEVVFDNLWRRADLSVRDRSLVTIAALAGMGDDDQLDFYLRRGVESGLTRDEMAEALTHLGFYAGWSKSTKAMTSLTRTLGGVSASPSQSVTASTATVSPEALAAARPSSNFTGSVAVTEPFRGTDGSRVGGATVTFQAESRTHWHTHPLGQLLVVTAGRGWVQTEGEPVRAIAAGDVVWTPPGAKHWHGATRTSAMAHVGISESQDGGSVNWLEPVSDAEYAGPGE